MNAELVYKIKSLNTDPLLTGYRFGVAGSYARNEETPESDIDIVTDKNMLTLEQISYIKAQFDRDVDIIQLPLAEEEDKRLDSFLINLDLPINDDSIYKSICREVIWYE